MGKQVAAHVGHMADTALIVPAALPLPFRVSHTDLQVYNEQIYDLLDEQGVGPLGQRAPLRLKEDSLGRVFVAGLAEVGAGATAGRRGSGQGPGG